MDCSMVVNSVMTCWGIPVKTEQIVDFRTTKLAAIEGQASMLKALGIYSFKQAISLDGHALFVFNRR